MRATAGEFGARGLRRMGLFHFTGRGEVGVVAGGAGAGTRVAAPAAFAMPEVEAAILGAHFLKETPVLSAVDAEEVAEARGAAVQELLLGENGGVEERIGGG